MIDKRINFRYGGDTMGGPNDKSNDQGETSSDSGFSDNSSNNTNNTNSGNDGPQHSPHTESGYTGPTNYGPQQPPQEIIGGDSFDVTSDNKNDREKARQLAQIMEAPIPNFTPKGIEYYQDGNLLGLAPKQKQFNMLSFLGNTAFALANPPLYAKYRKVKGMYDTAKYVTSIFDPMTTKNLNKPFETIENLTKNIGLKDKNVVQSFKDSLTSNLTPKSKSVINTNTGNDDNGIGTLENANVLQDEYTLLLQKLQTGNITDEERVRYTMLKNMLGI